MAHPLKLLPDFLCKNQSVFAIGVNCTSPGHIHFIAPENPLERIINQVPGRASIPSIDGNNIAPIGFMLELRLLGVVAVLDLMKLNN